MLAGVIRPTAGEVDIQGRVASLVDLSAGFHRDLTGHENLLIGGVLLGLGRAEVRERAEEIVAFSGLPDEALDWPLSAYSAGMGLRLGFSLVVHSDPDVLLVDEVLAVGDEAFQEQCVERVDALQAGGCAVVLVSHDMALDPGPLRRGGGARRRSGPPPRRAGRGHRRPRGDRRRQREVGAGRTAPLRPLPASLGGATAAARSMTAAATHRGPGPGLRELGTHRELLWTLVERQIRLRSKRSIMGVLWPLLSPFFLLALYTFVFASVFEVPVEDYGLYLFAGLLPWTFLVQTVNDSLQSISFEPDLVRRAPFPHQLLPAGPCRGDGPARSSSCSPASWSTRRPSGTGRSTLPCCPCWSSR